MLFNNFSGLHFYLCRQPTDMRKNFDGLSGVIESSLGANPLSGDVFIFINKRRDRIKLLLWDRNGFWLFYKRLEKGTFQLPTETSDSQSVELNYDALWMILTGIDLGSIKRRPRFSLLRAATL